VSRWVPREFEGENGMGEPELDGLVATYRDDGSLLAETTYRQGVRHGPYRDYWPNGRVSLEGQYVNGLQEGEWRFYDRDGSLREVLRFMGGREWRSDDRDADLQN
jgi:antitoxin component YwqK of YwqJK toxin-antitoxin module